MKQALVSKIVMDHPNEETQIYNGVIRVNGINQAGNIYHQWFPFDQIRFSVPNITGEMFNLNGLIVEVIFDDKIKGDFLITSIHEGETRSISGILSSKLSIEYNIFDSSIKSIDFNLVNFRAYFGNIYEFSPNTYITGELEFISKECNIVIQSRFKSDESKKLLSKYGGFLITHNGRMNFNNSISSTRSEFYLKRLSTFLSFLNGRRCGPRFIEASNPENQTVLKDYTPYLCDQYKYVQSWTPLHLESNFLKIWPSFLELTKDENDFERIDLIIHWYLEALNNSGFVNGSIILLQNSFEILFSWLVTENKKISEVGDNEKEKKMGKQ